MMLSHHPPMSLCHTHTLLEGLQFEAREAQVGGRPLNTPFAAQMARSVHPTLPQENI